MCSDAMRRCARLVLPLLFVAFGLGATTVGAQALRPEVDAFVAEMAERHQFDPAALRELLASVKPRPNILRLMSAPGTARPWHEFRPRYVDSARIEAGVRFWAENAGALAKARAKYGVSEAIIVATLGIETRYGQQVGRVKVLDALATLAFDYPRRAEFFRGELEAFLLLGRELDWDLTAVRGSYAGAMGLPQFLPSSYRRYAVDFDGDGRRDLWGEPDDAIGSVANYYRSFGWEEAAAGVVVPAALDERARSDVDTDKILPERTVGELMQRGATPLAPVPQEAKAAVIRLETQTGPQYWLALQNFYVITRYNRSVNYAMAVYELAREIQQRRDAERRVTGE